MEGIENKIDPETLEKISPNYQYDSSVGCQSSESASNKDVAIAQVVMDREEVHESISIFKNWAKSITSFWQTVSPNHILLIISPN